MQVDTSVATNTFESYKLNSSHDLVVEAIQLPSPVWRSSIPTSSLSLAVATMYARTNLLATVTQSNMHDHFFYVTAEGDVLQVNVSVVCVL